MPFIKPFINKFVIKHKISTPPFININKIRKKWKQAPLAISFKPRWQRLQKYETLKKSCDITKTFLTNF